VQLAPRENPYLGGSGGYGGTRLVARERFNEQEILEVTGLPPAPPLPSGVTAAPREGAAS
jgi:hypothetical protein